MKGWWRVRTCERAAPSQSPGARSPRGPARWDPGGLKLRGSRPLPRTSHPGCTSQIPNRLPTSNWQGRTPVCQKRTGLSANHWAHFEGQLGFPVKVHTRLTDCRLFHSALQSDFSENPRNNRLELRLERVSLLEALKSLVMRRGQDEDAEVGVSEADRLLPNDVCSLPRLELVIGALKMPAETASSHGHFG